MALLTINSHSLSTARKSSGTWRRWFWSLCLALRVVGIRPKNVVWTFDDFYRGEAESLKLVRDHGFKNLVVLYCPELLGRDDARAELRNPSMCCTVGDANELKELLDTFSDIQIGLHSLTHSDFQKESAQTLAADIKDSLAFHRGLFGAATPLFAFPYGRAAAECVQTAHEHFETVYLSDNRIAYTTDSESGLVNRIHLELGGNVAKFFIKILLSRLNLFPKRGTASNAIGDNRA